MEMEAGSAALSSLPASQNESKWVSLTRSYAVERSRIQLPLAEVSQT